MVLAGVSAMRFPKETDDEFKLKLRRVPERDCLQRHGQGIEKLSTQS